MAKHIIKEFRSKKVQSATDAVFASLQEKLTAALANERKLVAKTLVKEDKGILSAAKDGGVNLTVKGSDGKTATFWYKSRESAMEYVKSANITLSETIISQEPKGVNEELYAIIGSSSNGGSRWWDGKKFVRDESGKARAEYRDREDAKDALKQAKKEIFDAKIRILHESAAPAMPTNWDKGFDGGWQVASGGQERPFLKNGKWYLYVWNARTRRHAYYSYADDVYQNSLYESDEQSVKCDKCGTKIWPKQNPSGKCPQCDEPFKKLTETKMPVGEVQRVYDECGDIGETEILCGIKDLKVVNGAVVSFISEGINRYNVYLKESLKASHEETCPECKGNGWRNGVKLSTVCDRCAGAGKVLIFEGASNAELDRIAAWIDKLENQLVGAKAAKDWKEVARLQDLIADAEDDADRMIKEDTSKAPLHAHSAWCDVNREDDEDWSKPVRCTCGAQTRWEKEGKKLNESGLLFSVTTPNRAFLISARKAGVANDVYLEISGSGQHRSLTVSYIRALQIRNAMMQSNASGAPANARIQLESFTKKAIIREPGYPIGQTAPMYLMCVCGEKVTVPLLFTDQATFECYKCKQKYNRKGYMVESEGKKLPVIHAGSPIKTNASINRDHAMTMFKAGMQPADIAKAFPAVFKLDGGKLGQKYDYELGDGSGRYETKKLITRDAVSAAIKKFKGK